jgi:hypothetical protein
MKLVPLIFGTLENYRQLIGNDMKVFIYGAGGYFESVVYPILSSFKGVRIYLANRRPLVNFNYSKIYNFVYEAKNIDGYDLYMFAGNPIDSETFLKLVPKKSKVWIEKPCIPLNANVINLRNLVVENGLKVRTGLSRRMLLTSPFCRNFKNAYIGSGVAEYGSWKNMQVSGGSKFVDGIHAIDFALDMVEGGDISNWTDIEGIWKIDVEGVRKVSKIKLQIGNNISNEFKIDNQDFDFWHRKQALSCFKDNFNLALQGVPNFDEFYKNFTKIQNAAKRFKIKC